MIHKIIYKLGIRLRSPEIINKYKFLKVTEDWSLDELKAHQLQELKRIVKIAYERSSFYNKLYRERGIKPADIKVLEDISKLPVVSKKDLLNYNSQIQNKEGYRKLFYSETSGSTGEPLVLYRNSEWDATTRAAQLRGYSWYKINPWEKNGYLWGLSFDFKRKIKIKFLDFMLNRYRLFSYNEDEIKKFQNKIKKAAYLEGYSSMIYEIAKKINENSTLSNEYRLKMIKGTSEKIFDHYQNDIKKAFGLKMISEYGSCETGIIAFECPFGSMHIAMENVIVEEDNGEIVVTNLVSDSFPIIRYKLGDIVKLDYEKKCECGMQHQIISEILGRVGKVIQGKKENYPSLTLYYIFKNMAIKHGITLNYQAIQNEKGKLLFNIEQDISPITHEKLMVECYTYFHNDMEIFIRSNNLKRNYKEKFKDFISNIN